ncbi:gluconokinase [Parapedobacter soli]|uniref:gluconokinase n=1 Tax=Parapedobacter soli TaxID=416955 RepID=UPI0021CABFA6|nr:FGGY family carbohydrate kinase [Parapedobacter soli]
MATALAIDLGTTNLKVGLVNESGEILGLRSVAVPVINKVAGGAEHDPRVLKELIVTLARQVLSEGAADDVAYVVGSTYQFGLMLLDAQKKPLTGITLLADIRSQQTFDAFLDAYADVDIYAQTGCPLMTPYVLPRLFYFSRKEREVFDKAAYFTDSKAFLFEWLTGEFVTDVSTAAASQYYNLNDDRWDEALLSRLGLSAAQFPTIEDGTTYVGSLTDEVRSELGLKQQVKVLLGVYDGAALAVGLGAMQPGIGIMNVGTSAMLRVPGHSPAFDKDDNKRIQPYALKKGVFLNGGALNNAALPLNWLRNSLFDVDLQDQVMLHVGAEPPLLCLPYLTSERDSKTGPYASGVFFGMRQYHGKVDMARAMLEGVGYSMRYLYEALKENQLEVTEIRMGGGGAKIKTWPQIFANVLGLTIHIPPGEQMGLVGSAMLAFLADGHYRDITEMGERIIKMGIRVDPDSKVVPIHDQRYEFFKQVRETMAPLYREHAELARLL